jgi:hypothetical protein
MNNPLPKLRHLGAAALTVAAVAVVASPASAAGFRSHHAKRAAAAPAVTTAAVAPTPVAAPTVTSVISIGGYVFYNLTYAEAVDAWAAAVAAAPAGYVPPTVYSVSVNTTVSGDVENGNDA